MAMKISQGITQGLTLQSLCVSHEYKQREKKLGHVYQKSKH